MTEVYTCITGICRNLRIHHEKGEDSFFRDVGNYLHYMASQPGKTQSKFHSVLFKSNKF